MSTMRNAIQRRNHRERAQPLARSKWGLLEKGKDYKLRAKDHKEKQKRLKILREKAALANPDEFSFKMLSSATKNGQRIADRGNEALSVNAVKLLKTQDKGYLRVMAQRTRRERERLEGEVQVVGKGEVRALREVEDEEDEDDEEEEMVKARKITFVDTKDERDKLVDAVEDEDEEESDSGEAEEVTTKQLSRRTIEKLRRAEIEENRARKKREHQQQVRRNLLEAVRERERDLMQAEEELDLQRAKMSNSVGGVNKDGLKFKIRQRKR